MTDLRDTLQLFLRLFDREILAMILTLPRVYAFMAVSGLLAASAVPRPARVAVILGLSVVPAGINLAHVDGFDRQVASFAAYLAKEAAIGFVLGSLVGWVFWAVQSAGALIDNQRGSSMASSIDPLQGQETSPLGIAFSQVFLTYVFVAGAALPVIGVLYRSFALWPAPSALPILTERFPALMLGAFDHAVRFVVIMAAPIVAVMFLAEFALAMVSRFAPQVQVFVLAMPIKSGLAMFMLVVYFATLLPYAAGETAVFGRYVAALDGLLRAAPLPGGAR
ncbi:type III secretion system export apparatus subunit SctT [uncultured Methylobacterium sp.]|jgi:type III secretion protein T|uniref:type III secretion system export apparatus subunit SctT n=1 Tax=uncultured Methylobacterium sp. TaxID=157278 RepID=UPI002608CD35|nr:type III secretion system export apparatus subunit SctT [uncultured Methylobacterium sp.]